VPFPAAESSGGSDAGDAAALVVRAFLDGRNLRTQRAYTQDLAAFASFLGAADAQDTAARLLAAGSGGANRLALAYRAALSEQGQQGATINRRLAALRSLVKLARMLGVISWALEVPSVRVEPYRDTRGPGKEAFRRVLAACDGDEDRRKSARDRAVLRLLYDLGLRRGEVVALDFADFEPERAALQVLGKGRSGKVPLALARPTLDALNSWLGERGTAAGPLFLNFDTSGKGGGRLTASGIYRIVRARGEEAGVSVSPHGLRHTAITEACKAAQAAGIGLEEVLDFSRHKDVKVLMIYRDRERNVQGRLSSLVAETAGE